MPVIQDELWKHPGNPGMIVVTSHATLERDGRLWMASGAAHEAARRIPDIDLQCGLLVSQVAVDGVYGFLPVRPSRPDERVVGFGLFQTRIHSEESADLELIRFSMERLREYANQNPEVKMRMNFPGLQTGGLEPETIAPLLIPVPPNVTICHQGEVRQSFPDHFPGFKEIYVQVENMLQDNQYDRAVEFLVSCGFDIQSAYDQVNAVNRILTERRQRDTRYAAQHRSNRSASVYR